VPEGVLPAEMGLGQSPIVNVHLVLDRPVTDLALAAVVDSPIQFIFDRTASSGLRTGQCLSISLSAADEYIAQSSAQLVGTFFAALQTLLPVARTARLVDGVVTRERAATFRAGTGHGRPRPARPVPRSGSLPGRRVVRHRMAGHHGGRRAERRTARPGAPEGRDAVPPSCPRHARQTRRGGAVTTFALSPNANARASASLGRRGADGGTRRSMPPSGGSARPAGSRAPPPGRRREAGACGPLLLSAAAAGATEETGWSAPWPSS
jgi:hypothetical protein